MDPWPESSHKPLLRATFLSGSACSEAWDQWISQVNLDDYADSGSIRLLPHLFKNLKTEQIQHPFMQRLGGIVRKNWTLNKRTLDVNNWPWADFQKNKIEFILLPGAATALKTYSEYALIPPKETAVLIHPQDFSQTVRLLTQLNWEPQDEKIDGRTPSPRQYNTRWLGGDGRSLRLYWRASLAACQEDAAGAMFERAEPIQHQKLTLNTLGISDQILWAAALNLYGRPEPLFVRGVETMLVISAAGTINWPEIAALAQEGGQRQPLNDVLFYLQETLDLPLPPGYLRQLSEGQGFAAEARLISYNQRQTRGRHKALGLWLLHQHCSTADSWLAQALSFPRFLQQVWHLNALWQVPLHPAAVFLRRMTRSPQNNTPKS